VAVKVCANAVTENNRIEVRIICFNLFICSLIYLFD
jgi:hypothetical protein